jgi:hypothetical protein
MELKPRQRYRIGVITVGDDRGDLFDTEVHLSELGVPAGLKLGDR